MEECLVVSLKLCGLGLRLYFLLMVLGSMECKTDILFVVLNISEKFVIGLVH